MKLRAHERNRLNEKSNKQEPLPTAAEHKKADDAFEEGSRFSSTLAKISPVGIFQTDAQGNCLYVNECWCKIAGLTPAIALGKGWAQAIHPDDREKAAQAWYISAQAQQNFIMEYRMQRPGGVTRWVHGEAAAERDAAGKVVGYVGAVTDITQSKQVEESLRKSEARYRSLFENMLNGFAYCRMLYDDLNRPVDFIYLDVNEAFGRLTGLKNVVGKPVSEVIPGIMEQNPELLEIYDRVASTGISEIFDLDLKPLNKWFTISVYSPGKGCFVAVFDDITERKRLEIAQHETLDRLRKIASQAPGVVYQFRLRPDGSACVPYASEAAREIYRLDPEEIREDASGIFTPVHPDDLENFKSSIEASARDLAPWQHEYRLKFDDGTVRWLFGNSTPQREADGSTLWHGFLTDITGRKINEERALQSEAKLRAFLDNISDTLWLIDASLNISYVSPSVTHMLGALPGDLIGRPSALVIHPDDMAVVINAQRYVKEHPGEPHTIQYQVKHEHGRWIHVESTGVNMLGNPVINGVLVTMRDITSNKLSENALRASESRYRLLVESSPFCIHEIDLEGRLLSMNRAGLNMLGLEDAMKIRGKPYLGTVSPQDAGRVGALLQNAITNGASSHFEFYASSDVPQYFKSCFIPIKDADGKVLKLMGITENITGRKRAEQALAESESRFREIFNTVSDAIFIHDAKTGRIVDVNHRMCEMYGLTREEALACSPDDLSAGTPPYSSAEATEKIRLAHAEGPQTFDWLARARDGHLFWVEVSLQFALIGSQRRILAVVRDISERKHTEEEIRIAAIAFETQEGIVVTDANSMILRVNHAFTGITGYTAEEAIGRTPRLLKSDLHDTAFYAAMRESLQRTGTWKGEIWNRRKNGEVYPEQLTITAVKGKNGEVTHYVATMVDITERKRAEAQIYDLAFHDSLTRLPNRRLLNDRLEQTMASSKRRGLYGALMFLDMDNFKPLNDGHGHDVGDLLLVEVARRISSCVREVDTVARFGGDEFMVMLNELDTDKTESTKQAGIVAEKIRISLAEPYVLKTRHEGKAETTIEHRCTSSIGVALFINHDVGAENLLKWADMAMYQAKEAGGNSIRFHE